LTIDDQWDFIGGPWRQNADGVINPPKALADEYLAFYAPAAYGDFEAEFEFRWETPFTTGGFIFRAADARHYYVLDFPAVGQQTRTEYFWVAVSKVDHRGYRQGLHLQNLYGVSSAGKLWQKVGLRVTGNEIAVTVNGRAMTTICDDTYAQPGRIGLATYSALGGADSCSYRSVRIRGRALEPPEWDQKLRPRRNWGIVDPVHGTGCGNLVRAANGDLLTLVGPAIRRSSDNGLTWHADDPMPEGYHGHSLMHAAADSSVNLYRIEGGGPWQIQTATSKDHGRTWSDWRDVGTITFPPELPFDLVSQGRLLETKDGSLLMLCMGLSPREDTPILQGRWTMKGWHPSMNFCLRSTDGGQTWSAPINMDGPPYDNSFPQFHKEGSEISAAQTKEGKILAMMRPIFSGVMWETWSEDDGQTWTPMMRSAFPMYGCFGALTTTSSGFLIIGGRFPGLGVQVSYDSGMTWQFHQVDATSWANGAMYEIEPDVVLFVYGGWNQPMQLRYQIIRVTESGLEPLPVRGIEQFIDTSSIEVLPLDDVWQFKLDPNKVGDAQRWCAPDAPDDDWEQLSIHDTWTNQGHDDYHGSGWYRTQFSYPEQFDTRKYLWLLFEAADKEAYVYVDGERVFEHTFASTGLTASETYRKPFVIDAREVLEPGRQHTITVRVDSEEYAGGLWHPVSLVSLNGGPDLALLALSMQLNHP